MVLKNKIKIARAKRIWYKKIWQSLLEHYAKQYVPLKNCNFVLVQKKPVQKNLSKFTMEQIIKIVNLACKDPKEYGCESIHWSLSFLMKEIIKSGIAHWIP